MCQLGSGPAILLWSQSFCHNRNLEMDSVTLLPSSLRHTLLVCTTTTSISFKLRLALSGT